MCAEALYATARGLGCYRYPLLLTCPDLRTHAAFSPLVVPGGHANVQALATLSEARRRGHCRGLLREAERMMRGAGVPRLVIMYSDNSAAGGGEGEEGDRAAKAVAAVERGFKQRMGWRELELDVLAGFKGCGLSEYHRDLTRRRAFLTKLLG